jgi:hypothetical protein
MKTIEWDISGAEGAEQWSYSRRRLWLTARSSSFGYFPLGIMLSPNRNCFVIDQSLLSLSIVLSVDECLGLDGRADFGMLGEASPRPHTGFFSGALSSFTTQHIIVDRLPHLYIPDWSNTTYD